MTRTGADAIAYARSRVGGTMPDSGLCLQFVRTCFDVPSYYYSAIDAWNAAARKHPGDRNPPPAVPLWFATPSQYDHVVFCCSTGEIVSTWNAEIRSYPSIGAIEQAFDGTYLGWAEDINRVTIWTEDDDMPSAEEVAAAVWGYQLHGTDPVTGGPWVDAAGRWLSDAREDAVPILHADVFWSRNITGSPDGGQTVWSDRADAWLRDARIAPQLSADVAHVSDQIDAVASSSVRAWPSTLALILAVAIIAGLFAGLISQVVQDGAITAAATLIGGLVGWAASTLGGRVARHRRAAS